MPYLLGGKQRGGSEAEPTNTDVACIVQPAGPSSNQHDAHVALALASFTVRNLPVVDSFHPRVRKCADYSWNLEGMRTS